MDSIIIQLLASDDPCVRLKTRLRVLGEDAASPEMRKLAEAVRSSDRVRAMVSLRDADGRIPGSAYAKFTGAHWILPILADLGYPAGDTDLVPLRDQVYATWLDPKHTQERVVERESARYKSQPGVPIIDGRARRCASQQGNALWSTLALGIADGRADELARLLIRWQWPDGGWNCDRKTGVVNSSYMESLIPMRALALHGRLAGDSASTEAALRASDIFLKRRLFRRQADGSVMNEDFVKLHYPCYWHYDILFGLKVLGRDGTAGRPALCRRAGSPGEQAAARRRFPGRAPALSCCGDPRQRRLARRLGRHQPQADESLGHDRRARRAAPSGKVIGPVPAKCSSLPGAACR